MELKQRWRDKWTWEQPGIGFLDADPIVYDQEYFNHYVELEQTRNGQFINTLREELVNHAVIYQPQRSRLLDVGIGSGSFLRHMTKNFEVYGHEVNPVGIDWLKKNNYYCPNIFLQQWDVVTFWDSLEHIPQAHTFIQSLDAKAICLSLPVFLGESDVFSSKHFKPGEHYHYFTVEGLIKWFSDLGYSLHKFNRDERLVGRQGIGSFAFKKNEVV